MNNCFEDPELSQYRERKNHILKNDEEHKSKWLWFTGSRQVKERREVIYLGLLVGCQL